MNILDIITTKEIGARLKIVRKGLALTQTEVAKEIHSTQLLLSKIERGIPIRTEVFIRLLAFYSQSVSLDILFSPELTPINIPSLFDKNIAIKSVIKSRIQELKQQTEKEIKTQQENIEKNLQQVLDLL